MLGSILVSVLMGKCTISSDYIFLRFLCQGPQVSLHFPVTVAAVGFFDTGSHVYFLHKNVHRLLAGLSLALL